MEQEHTGFNYREVAKTINKVRQEADAATNAEFAAFIRALDILTANFVEEAAKRDQYFNKGWFIREAGV